MDFKKLISAFDFEELKALKTEIDVELNNPEWKMNWIECNCFLYDKRIEDLGLNIPNEHLAKITFANRRHLLHPGMHG